MSLTWFLESLIQSCLGNPNWIENIWELFKSDRRNNANNIFSLKTNKSRGYDKISSNVLRNCLSELNDFLKYLFEKSLEKGSFPDGLKIAKVTPPFKRWKSPFLSKTFDRIMYNLLYKYLTTEKLHDSKEFDFQAGLLACNRQASWRLTTQD